MFGLARAAQGPRALARQFPHVEADAVAAFVETCEGGVLGAEIVACLREMQEEAMAAAPQGLLRRRCKVAAAGPGAFELELGFEGGDEAPHVGTLLAFEGLEDLCEPEGKDGSGPSIAVAVPSGEVLCLERQEAPTFFQTQEYGTHELRVRGKDDGSLLCGRFMVTSSLGDFAEAMDLFNDSYDWAWDGTWTEELEEAAVMLLSILDDHYRALEEADPRKGEGEGVLSTIESPKSRIEKHLGRALESHDTLALGRGVAALRAFLLAESLLEMFSPGLVAAAGVGEIATGAFYEGLRAFERARFAAASEAKKAEVRAALSKLINTADAHVAGIHGGKAQDFVKRWQQELREPLLLMMGDVVELHPLPFQQLRGGSAGHIADVMASVVEAFGSQSAAVQRAETTEALCTLGQEVSFVAAEAKVTRWVESLVDESIRFGNALQSFEVHPDEPYAAASAAAIQSLLSLGFGYVAQGGKHIGETAKLAALLDRVRGALPLQSSAEFLRDRRRRERLREAGRLVRSARKKGQRLSLAVNTDFAGALAALREHHADSWVGRSLEGVWDKMLPSGGVFCFELWLHEEGQPAKLVAADFGHPHTFGRVYYVATRFFDRSVRTVQPGFILAFAEAECLRRAGFELWDLGGVDASPMMQYKPQVALEMPRSDFLRRFREVALGATAQEAAGPERLAQRALPLTSPQAAPPSGGQKVPTGVVFPDLGESDLWGLADLKAQEEEAARAWKAQKPAKAAKAPKGKPREQQQDQA